MLPPITENIMGKEPDSNPRPSKKRPPSTTPKVKSPKEKSPKEKSPKEKVPKEKVPKVNVPKVNVPKEKSQKPKPTENTNELSVVQTPSQQFAKQRIRNQRTFSEVFAKGMNGANNSGANNSDANHSDANHSDANNSGTNHSGANNSGTNHSGTNHSDANHSDANKLGINVETSVYNYTIREAIRNGIVRKTTHMPFVVLYTSRLRSVWWNLTTNPTLYESICSGEITPQMMETMTHMELNMEKWKEELRAKTLRDQSRFANKETACTSVYTCRKCRSRKCTFCAVQIRSSDEPMTVFVTCLDCGKNFTA